MINIKKSLPYLYNNTATKKNPKIFNSQAYCNEKKRQVIEVLIFHLNATS